MNVQDRKERCVDVDGLVVIRTSYARVGLLVGEGLDLRIL